jgi:hypothetical protein
MTASRARLPDEQHGSPRSGESLNTLPKVLGGGRPSQDAWKINPATIVCPEAGEPFENGAWDRSRCVADDGYDDGQRMHPEQLESFLGRSDRDGVDSGGNEGVARTLPYR